MVDASGFSVKVTLWGKQAEQYNEVDYPVIAFKGAKVGDFQGSSLTSRYTHLIYAITFRPLPLDDEFEQSHHQP